MPACLLPLIGTVFAGAWFFIGSNATAQNLFVGSCGKNNITEVTTNGATIILDGDLGYPTGLAFNRKGDLFVSDQFPGIIYKYPAEGGARILFASGLNQPNQMAIDAAGDLFVNVLTNAVLKLTPDGSVSTFASGLTGATGIAFDRKGNLYVGSSRDGTRGSGYIYKMTPAGVTSIYTTNLYWISGIAFDGMGNLYVTSGLGNTVTKITPDGRKSTFASWLNSPNELAFNAAGDLFVDNSGLHGEKGSITEFAPDGTVIATITSVANPMSLAFQGLTLPVQSHHRSWFWPW
jgi:sugar lactone lactonase YvrE